MASVCVVYDRQGPGPGRAPGSVFICGIRGGIRNVNISALTLMCCNAAMLHREHVPSFHAVCATLMVARSTVNDKTISRATPIAVVSMNALVKCGRNSSSNISGASNHQLKVGAGSWCDNSD
jgi:hypothetical protein